MSATPKTQPKSAVPHKDPRGRRRPVGWHGAAPLELKYLEAHADLLKEPKPRSGRSGGYVYWYYNGRLYWRRYVIPQDPRTPTQRRSRAAFGAASNAWSENQPLSEEQRAAWRAAAAKVTTKPRLWQCGWRTAQTHFVGTNARKEHWGLPLILEPPQRRRKKAECRMQNKDSSAPAPQPAIVAGPPGESRSAPGASPTSLPRARMSCAARATAPRVPPQVVFPERLMRPSSDWRRCSTVLVPVHCRWRPASPGHFACIPSPDRHPP